MNLVDWLVLSSIYYRQQPVEVGRLAHMLEMVFLITHVMCSCVCVWRREEKKEWERLD